LGGASAIRPIGIAASRPFVLPGTFDLGVEDLLELLGQSRAHAGPGRSVRGAVATPVSGCFNGR
jgi:hypothetical protein